MRMEIEERIDKGSVERAGRATLGKEVVGRWSRSHSRRSREII